MRKLIASLYDEIDVVVWAALACLTLVLLNVYADGGFNQAYADLSDRCKCHQQCDAH